MPNSPDRSMARQMFQKSEACPKKPLMAGQWGHLVGGPEACRQDIDSAVYPEGFILDGPPLLKLLLLVTGKLQVSDHALHLQDQRTFSAETSGT